MKILLSLILLLPQCLFSLHTETHNFANAQLEKIAAEHYTLLQSIKDIPSSDRDLTRRFENVLKSYESFITYNPGCAEAYVLYGKLLRTVGQKTQAHAAFIKANKINPHIPVVKQQIANYLAEVGGFGFALAYMLQATELSPNEPQYHYQLGEILYTYKDAFLKEKILTPESFDTQMLTAFEKAKNLKTEERIFSIRHAEAFYDLCTPRWEDALKEWEKLEKNSPNPIDKQIIYLHKARGLIMLGKIKEAKECLSQVIDSKLQSLKKQVESDLPNQLIESTIVSHI